MVLNVVQTKMKDFYLKNKFSKIKKKQVKIMGNGQNYENQNVENQKELRK